MTTKTAPKRRWKTLPLPPLGSTPTIPDNVCGWPVWNEEKRRSFVCEARRAKDSLLCPEHTLVKAALRAAEREAFLNQPQETLHRVLHQYGKTWLNSRVLGLYVNGEPASITERCINAFIRDYTDVEHPLDETDRGHTDYVCVPCTAEWLDQQGIAVGDDYFEELGWGVMFPDKWQVH